MTLTTYDNIGFFPYNNGSAPVHMDASTEYLYQVRVQGGNMWMMRSIDDGANWSAQGGTQSVLTSGKWVDSHYDGSVIHVATVDDDGNAVCEYHVFTISSNSWTTLNTTVFAGDSAATARECGITVRSSGDIVIACQGTTERNKGTDYERVSLFENTGGGFGSAITIGTGVNSHYILGGGMITDDGARVWINYTIGTTVGNQYARYLSDGSTSLSSEFTIASGSYRPPGDWGTTNTGVGLTQHTHGGSTDRKTFAFYKNIDSEWESFELDGTGTATSGGTISSTWNTPTNSRGSVFVRASTDTVYFMGWENDGTDAVHSSDSGSGWSSGTVHGNVGGGANRNAGTILTRGSGQVVIAYINYDNTSGTFDYNEWELVAGTPPTGTVFVTKYIVGRMGVVPVQVEV